ncbi:2Fe-2S iron-sulfur cluster-binding protein [Streptomyces sp. DSM 42041]|uniref:2Fe-2S iron-sulfur cluster-binding protein n=1 Tax=Streptomyces hazeniae TaxID=3075538 RepID=A0ABU2NX88_9ACTN|nr:2Fe-2S iron-sulfur cluster-binding protein [Streptomyces sp. DSM 42041]MDT0381598.1 2Fe-2S iron-sulfur cluster-binding protein [Streptomyces sp. DSM 42041]
MTHEPHDRQDPYDPQDPYGPEGSNPGAGTHEGYGDGHGGYGHADAGYPPEAGYPPGAVGYGDYGTPYDAGAAQYGGHGPAPHAGHPAPAPGSWGGEYDADATAFVQLPGPGSSLPGADPLAAPGTGQGYTPPALGDFEPGAAGGHSGTGYAGTGHSSGADYAGSGYYGTEGHAVPTATGPGGEPVHGGGGHLGGSPMTPAASTDPSAAGQWTMPFAVASDPAPHGGHPERGQHPGPAHDDATFGAGAAADDADAHPQSGGMAAAMGQGAAAALAGSHEARTQRRPLGSGGGAGRPDESAPGDGPDPYRSHGPDTTAVPHARQAPGAVEPPHGPAEWPHSGPATAEAPGHGVGAAGQETQLADALARRQVPFAGTPGADAPPAVHWPEPGDVPQPDVPHPGGPRPDLADTAGPRPGGGAPPGAHPDAGPDGYGAGQVPQQGGAFDPESLPTVSPSSAIPYADSTPSGARDAASGNDVGALPGGPDDAGPPAPAPVPPAGGPAGGPRTPTWPEPGSLPATGDDPLLAAGAVPFPGPAQEAGWPGPVPDAPPAEESAAVPGGPEAPGHHAAGEHAEPAGGAEAAGTDEPAAAPEPSSPAPSPAVPSPAAAGAGAVSVSKIPFVESTPGAGVPTPPAPAATVRTEPPAAASETEPATSEGVGAAEASGAPAGADGWPHDGSGPGPDDSGEYVTTPAARAAAAAEPAEAAEPFEPVEAAGPPEAADPVPPGTPDPAGPAPADQPEPAPAGLAHSDHPHVSYVLRVNGVDRPVSEAWIGESLLYVLRERLGLAGAKDGCSQGECGACSVQVDGRLVASCLVPAATAAGSEVRTVEGLAEDGEPSDVQRALTACGAVQCGFCVPGLAMAVHDLLEGNHAPTELETRQAICGNLCRCSGYRGVLDAVDTVVSDRADRAAREGQPEGGDA